MPRTGQPNPATRDRGNHESEIPGSQACFWQFCGHASQIRPKHGASQRSNCREKLERPCAAWQRRRGGHHHHQQQPQQQQRDQRTQNSDNLNTLDQFARSSPTRAPPARSQCHRPTWPWKAKPVRCTSAVRPDSSARRLTILLRRSCGPRGTSLSRCRHVCSQQPGRDFGRNQALQVRRRRSGVFHKVQEHPRKSTNCNTNSPVAEDVGCARPTKKKEEAARGRWPRILGAGVWRLLSPPYALSWRAQRRSIHPSGLAGLCPSRLAPYVWAHAGTWLLPVHVFGRRMHFWFHVFWLFVCV